MQLSAKISICIAVLTFLSAHFRVQAAPTHEGVAHAQHQHEHGHDHDHEYNDDHDHSSQEATTGTGVITTSDKPEPEFPTESDVMDKISPLNSDADQDNSKVESPKSDALKLEKTEDEPATTSNRPKRQHYDHSHCYHDHCHDYYSDGHSHVRYHGGNSGHREYRRGWGYDRAWGK